jgi:hypothetical protein
MRNQLVVVISACDFMVRGTPFSSTGQMAAVKTSGLSKREAVQLCAFRT